MKRMLNSPAHIQMDIWPTDREFRWFAQIDRHGPQSSEFLFELTRGTHRCKDTSLRRLQALREAGYLRLPPQQQQIAKADFNPHVYDLTKLGWDTLSDQQALERDSRPTGHWWHGYWVSSVSSAIQISVERSGLSYIPAARILAIKEAELGIPIGRSKLIPDQMFAIKYQGGYKAFALEVDRGTEPLRSSAARKSLKRSLEQYQEVLKERLYQQHYGLKSKLAVCWVFSSRGRERQFKELLPAMDYAQQTVCIPQAFPRWGAVVNSGLKSLTAR